MNNTNNNNNNNLITSKIEFYKSKNNNDCTFDAINNHISNLDACQELKFNNYYYVNNFKEFKINKDIFCKVHNISKEIEDICYFFELYSNTLKLAQLKNFVNKLKKKYIYEKNNKLNNKKYYFDEHHVAVMRNSDNSIKFSTAPKQLTFTMTQFNTNKSLNNVFGKHLEVIRQRMDLFCNRKDWYKQKGIPHTLGILLHKNPTTYE